MTKNTDQDIIQRAIKNLSYAIDADSEHRRLSVEDYSFYYGEQWPREARLTRQMPGNYRPCLSINVLPPTIRQVTNDMRQNKPSIKVLPSDSSEKSEEIAEIMDGLIRAIQNRSEATTAYATAGMHQVIAGVGYIRIRSRYVSDDSFDQEIFIDEVKNPLDVYVDPNAFYPDWRWALVMGEMSTEDYKRQYGADDISFQTGNITSTQQDWFKKDVVRIAEYYEVVDQSKKIYQLSDGSVSDKKPDPLSGLTVVKQRDSKVRKVMWYKMSATKILEQSEWPDSTIPIVPVYGEELIIDGKIHRKGMVRDAKDPIRMYNYSASAAAEALALAPKAPWIMAEGQVEGYENFWNNANIESRAYLPYRPQTINGIMVPPPQRIIAEPPVAALVNSIQMAYEDIKRVTGIHDASLGAKSNETSGKAILARQREGDTANYHYVDNLSRAIAHVGNILVAVIPHFYDTERAIRILHADEQEEIITINSIFERKGKGVYYSFDDAKYDVVVVVGPSYATKRLEASESMMQFVQAVPNAGQVVSDLIAQNMDWPGAKEISERLRKTLPPELVDDKGESGEIPPQIKQQIMQAQQMIDQLTAALNDANNKLETKQMELESRERIAAQNNETKLVVAELQNNLAVFTEELAHLRHRQDLLRADKPIDADDETISGSSTQPQTTPVDNMQQ